MQTLILFGIGVFVGIFIAILQREIIFFTLPPILFTLIGVAVFQKNVTTDQSFWDICCQMFQFQKSQKQYYYQYTNLYESE